MRTADNSVTRLRRKPGRAPSAIWSRIYRITLYPEHTDLKPFFEQLGQLPPGQRNMALLAAIRGGAAAGQAAIEQPDESHKVSAALDTLLDNL